MSHILIPRTPSMNLLRPFIECPTSELDQAYAAMIRIAEVERARAGSQCLAQIEEPAGAASAAVSRRGEYPPLPEGVMFIEQIGGDVIARPTEYAYFKNARGVVHGAQLFTADQLRAYFDLGRQPPAAPALEAPAAPADGATPGPWFVRKREVNGELRDCFVAAPDCQGLAYDACILCDDEYHDGMGRKLADCELIVAAVNQHRAALAAAPQAPAAPVHSKTYSDGTVATGSGELPAQSPQQQVLCTLLDTVEAMLGGANGPTIQIRAALLAAPAAPDDVLCYIRPGATLSERHGFEVCRATDAGAMAVTGDGRAHAMPTVTPAEFAADIDQMLAAPAAPADAQAFAEWWDDYERAWTMLLGMAAPAVGNWIAAEEVDRLVRDLDVALHGEADAAPQASLCDIVGLAKAAADKLGRPVLAAPAAPAVDATSDTALLDAMQRHRIALVPEFEGPWDAEIFNDEAEAPLIASGNTPREALHAALAAQAKEGGEPA